VTENEVEREIADHLAAERSLDVIASQCLARIISGDCSFEERKARFGFLFRGGFFEHMFNVYIQSLDQGIEVPLSYLLETLVIFKQIPPRDLVANFLKQPLTLRQKQEMVLSRAWDSLDQRVVAWRRNLIMELKSQSEARDEQLRDRLAFYQNQRMVEEERKFLNYLLKVYPHSKEFVAAQKSFDERWARHVIAEAASNQFDEPKTEQKALALNAEQWPLAKVLLEGILELIAENPERATDFAILLWFLELYPQALIVLDKGNNTEDQRWFRIELLLVLRRFVDALQEVQELENEFGANPETPFAATYLRAQALQGLGQVAQALELMRSLVNVRPDYRSARSYLAKWTEGVD
jgi:tetratricopeptide (TPR) repeat protein